MVRAEHTRSWNYTEVCIKYVLGKDRISRLRPSESQIAVDDTPYGISGSVCVLTTKCWRDMQEKKEQERVAAAAARREALEDKRAAKEAEKAKKPVKTAQKAAERTTGPAKRPTRSTRDK